MEFGNGWSTIIDEQDEEFFRQYKWHISSTQGAHRYVCSRMGHGRGFVPVKLHRVLLNALSGQIVDHRNRDTLDNRRGNLRFATVSQNAANRRTACKSGFLGVAVSGSGKFYGRVTLADVPYDTAPYRTAEEAARARDALALLHFGEFAALNFPHPLNSPPSLNNVHTQGDA